MLVEPSNRTGWVLLPPWGLYFLLSCVQSLLNVRLHKIALIGPHSFRRLRWARYSCWNLMATFSDFMIVFVTNPSNSCCFFLEWCDGLSPALIIAVVLRAFSFAWSHQSKWALNPMMCLFFSSRLGFVCVFFLNFMRIFLWITQEVPNNKWMSLPMCQVGGNVVL